MLWVARSFCFLLFLVSFTLVSLQPPYYGLIQLVPDLYSAAYEIVPNFTFQILFNQCHHQLKETFKDDIRINGEICGKVFMVIAEYKKNADKDVQ
ncbi:CLUMA_CG005865, isoform A [Clunio marinus]|uniref:CLUMA_CG005865, isoform A n=1 Tax=Clunio marinus TaxID=568069 RepID=A0A1J1HWC6_9DIPT|nr:CLUMA_CG005865, isoform A [Clunio marinus]